MKKYFATLDIGTSSIKGIIWNIHGECLYSYQQSSPPLKINNLLVEQCLHEFKNRIILVLEQLNAAVSLTECHCLAISTQRNTLILKDQHQELTPLISWLDGRGKMVNGNRIDWFKKLFPDFKNAQTICSLISWLIQKLSGRYVETASSAPQDWLTSQTQYTNIKGPELVTHGKIIHANVAEDFTQVIPKGLPILIGAGDKDCALLGGLALNSRVVLCAGTAFSLGKLVNASKQSLHRHDSIYYSQSQFVNYYPIETGLPYPSGLISYLQSHHQFNPNHMLSELPATRAAIFCFPGCYRLQTDNMTMNTRFHGIDEAHSNQIVAAGLEGIILELMYCQSILNSTGEFFDEIVLGGNNIWLKNHANWLADALQCKVIIYSKLELTSFGLAMSALSFINHTKDYFASKIIKQTADIIHPNPQNVKHWQYRFEQYCFLRKILNED